MLTGEKLQYEVGQQVGDFNFAANALLQTAALVFRLWLQGTKGKGFQESN